MDLYFAGSVAPKRLEVVAGIVKMAFVGAWKTSENYSIPA